MGPDEYRRLHQALKKYLGYNEMVKISAETSLPLAPPIRASLRVTSRCNSDCVYCPYRYSLSSERNDLPLHAILQAIDTMADLGVKVLFLSGGEPLLRRDIMQICSHARRREMMVQLSTNGLLLTHQVVLSLNEAGLSNLIMSLDSLDEEVYSQHRGVHNLQIHEKLNMLNVFADLRPENSSAVTFVVSKKNFRELPDFVRFIENFSDGRIRVNIQPFHNLQYSEDDGLSPSTECKIALKKIMKQVVLLKKAGCHINVSEEYLHAIPDFLLHECMLDGPCLVGYFGMYVMENLDVRPCWKLPPVGNLGCSSAMDIWLSSAYVEARNRMTRKSCSGCLLLCNQTYPVWFESLYKPQASSLKSKLQNV